MLNEKEIKDWFVAEVRERMDDLGLRPYHMSPLCHIKYDSLSTYLSGLALPNPWSLVLMAEHLEASVDELLGYEGLDDVNYEPYLASAMYRDKEQFATCVSDRLKRYFNKQGLTVDDVSDKTGVSISTLKRWTSSRPTLPRTWDLLRLCDGLDCTPSELLGY